MNNDLIIEITNNYNDKSWLTLRVYENRDNKKVFIMSTAGTLQELYKEAEYWVDEDLNRKALEQEENYKLQQNI